MIFLFGVFLLCVGGFQTLMLLAQLSSMNEFERYLIGDQITASLAIWGLVLLAGIGLTWFAYNKKKTQDSKALLNNLNNQMTRKCSNCGLDLAPGTAFCPQCNNRIGGNEHV